jgi:hypothetical protein
MTPTALKSKLESDAYFYTSDEGKKLVQVSQETYEELKNAVEYLCELERMRKAPDMPDKEVLGGSN